MDIPAEILDKLKCVGCNKYLSRSPVYIEHGDGTSLCVECFTPGQLATRNKPYESVAKLLKFPCKYQDLGCVVTVPFIDETGNFPHEEECNFRQYECPVLSSGGCSWTGTKGGMLAHCRVQHPDHIVGNPVVLTHDIRRSSIRTYLITAFHMLFLLHTKVCVSTGKIFHAVRFLGESAKAGDFDFSVQIKRKKISVFRPGKVAPQGCLAINDPISVVLNISSLLDVLGGFEGTIFTVVLKRLKKCVQCGKNVLSFTFRDRKGWWCEECTPDKRICKNQHKQCTYADIDQKCGKHERYFCQFSKKCYICNPFGGYNITEESLYVHYNTLHQAETFKVGSIWRATRTVRRCYLISSVAGIAVCDYIMNDSLFSLWIYMPVTSNHLSNYCCTVRITRPGTNDSRTFTPDLESYTERCDWDIKIKKDKFPWKDDGVDIVIDITQK